jgi:hypothetical protein
LKQNNYAVVHRRMRDYIYIYLYARKTKTEFKAKLETETKQIRIRDIPRPRKTIFNVTWPPFQCEQFSNNRGRKIRRDHFQCEQ